MTHPPGTDDQSSTSIPVKNDVELWLTPARAREVLPALSVDERIDDHDPATELHT
ncbi:hypothetical protein HLH33_10000 [Gluconacetobacter diazotrophicus]|uniref:Uncharacterized protein n=1 Tax=Gluconacetobacter diazotrophicus TaxID=33996 RepID=A0A7W4FFD1_GLUDI|nr:hypothetical protein [Gluconacetobacter diazotrophicus]MBB2156637.1 hypothetical protein [Gluconacetobacter diazotrophicus]